MSADVSTALSLLEEASLVRPGDPGGDGEYRFKHTLIQETAYAGLLRERRGELHRQVAEAILHVNPEAGAYQPAVLAFHYYHGGDDDRAFRFAVRAGQLASRNYAHQEAISNYDLALEVAPRLTSTDLAPLIREAFIGKGTALEISGRHAEAVALYHAMEAFARRTANPALEADALNRLAAAATVSSDPSTDVAEMLLRAEQLARQSGAPLTLARTLWNQGLRLRFIDPVRAEEFFLKALEITRSPACVALPPEAGVRETEAHILIDLMVSGLTSGRRQMALRNGAQALAAFRELGNLAMVADALAGLANLHQAGADFETVIRFSEEGQAISSAIDNPWGLTYNGWAHLQVDADRAEWSRALEDGTRLLTYAARVPFIGFRLALNSILTRVWIDLGQPHTGAQHARAMSRLWEESAWPTEGWSSWVRAMAALSHLSLGEIGQAADLLENLRELQPGVIPGFQNYYYVGPTIAQLDLARGDFERGLAFATELIDRFDAEATDRFTAEMLYWRGRLHLGRGAPEAARADCQRALDLLRPTGARAIQWPIHAALAEALEGSGDEPSAAAQRQAARAMVETISSGLHDATLRSSFASRPEVARLFG